ncbi:MAG: thrombospondin type 3 repeat-containing protein [Chitinophagaceae bacterium]
MKAKLFFLVLFFGITLIVFAQVQTKKDCSKDLDKDGISDCFDMCANTPEGVRVDNKGCPRDTDGDGIPDYLDKQLITPTECQPSDSNGIGDCNRIYKK